MGREKSGSVSVYFIVITAAIFLFNAVLIDYARVASMNNQLEAASRSGIRSVLSAYDEQLYDRYGLFARGGSDAGAIFERVLENSITSGESSSFRLLDIQVEASHVNSSSYLGIHPVFKRQVLEEMKYKAPIDFTVEMLSKFKPLSSALEEAAATVDVLEKMEKLYEARERHLSSAIMLQKKAADALASSGVPLLLPAGGSGGSGYGTVSGIAENYASYVDWVLSDEDLEEDEKPQYTIEIASFRQSSTMTAFSLRRLSAGLISEHTQMQQQAQHEVESAKKLNEQMRELAQQAESSSSHAGQSRLDGVSGSKGAVPDQVPQQLKEVRLMSEDLVMEAGWFDDFQDEINRQASDFTTLDMETVTFEAQLSAALSSASLPSTLPGTAVRLQSAYADYRQKYIQPASILAARENGMLSMSAGEADRKEQRTKQEAKLNEARKLLQRMNTIQPTDEQKQAFEKLKGHFEKNRLANQSAEPAEPAEPEHNGSGAGRGDAAQQADQSLDTTRGMFGGMAEMLVSIRDPLYLNEYAVSRFSSLSPQNLSAVVLGEGEEVELSGVLDVNQQEIEYILYGFHHPASNIAAAYAEIFAFRLAIRTMEGLVQARTLGHPLMILSAALLYGLEKSLEDIVQLVKQGSTPLSKYADVDIAYKDYLRMFLLIHGSPETKISRMIALIEFNTGYSLIQMTAGVSGEARGSVKLWFLPGIMKSLTRTRLLSGKVVGNRYESTKTAAWSYS
ncbi:hypothetical protein ACFOHW_03200 [Paenibacillus abyssi]|uniref:hypothetical protein n=1 Tax=Paenibacillus abyssi TaxID=1340531 RepID=UPI00361F64B1